MIIKYYKGNISLDKLYELCKTTKKGTSAFHIVSAALVLGFKSSGSRCSLEYLYEGNVSLPVIAFVTIDKSYLHYVVIYEINVKHKYLVIADPMDKVKKMDFFEFGFIYNDIILNFQPITNIIYENTSFTFLELLLNIFRKFKKDFFYFLFYSILFTFFSIIFSYYNSNMIKSIYYNDKNYILYIFVCYLLISLLKNISNYIKSIFLININKKVDFVFQTEVFKNILSLPYKYYRYHPTGDIVSKIGEISRVKDVLSSFLMFLFVDIPLSLISLFFIYKIDVYFVYISVVSFIILTLISFVLERFITSKLYLHQSERSKEVSFMVEAINGFESIKGTNKQSSIFDTYIKKYISFLSINFSLESISSFINFIKSIISSLSFLVIILVGTYRCMDGQIKVEQFFTLVTLFGYFMGPSEGLLLNIISYKEIKISIERIYSLFRTSSSSGFIDSRVDGNILVNSLTYTYNDKDFILSDVSFSISPGEKVLVLGKSGSGKSTFLKILKKYYSVSNNRVFIDNIDINNYKNLNFNYISQNETLFTDSLYNNLTMYGSVNNSHLSSLIKICEVDRVIDNNGLGLNMLIEENGFNLSGGEKQRIILVRSLLCDFDVLLIDEGLSQMDVSLERRILKRLFYMYLKKTVIIVSHRTDNIDLYDKVIRFDNKVKVYKKDLNGKFLAV